MILGPFVWASQRILRVFFRWFPGWWPRRRQKWHMVLLEIYQSFGARRGWKIDGKLGDLEVILMNETWIREIIVIYCYIVHVVGIVVIFNPCQILAISTMIVSNWYSWDCMLVLCSCQCFYFGSRTITHYQQHVCCYSCCWVILILLWFQPKLNWRFGVGWNPREPRQG